MKRYDLQDLARVRQHREEQASEAVARATRALREAQARLDRAQKELADYTVWRVQEERRKLDAVMRRVLKVGELSDVRQEIALLREREFEFVDHVQQADVAVSKAEAHLDEGRRKHAQAVRELEKLLEHRATWQREIAREAERADDAELEDFNSPRLALNAAGDLHERN